jgi:hypothetical protein
MKFLIDAQLPRRLAHQLRAAGLETAHTRDLEEVNRTLLDLSSLARDQKFSGRDGRHMVRSPLSFQSTIQLECLHAAYY